MNLEVTIREALVNCLIQIQTSSGKFLSVITDVLKPLGDLEDFNSEVWPIASGMLQAELGILIPGKTNIFKDAVSKKPLSIEEIVANLVAQYPKWTVSTPTAVTK